ncbi:hypothetical protein FJT64_026756 [Amphibalanus amphitrite]|uniref:DUF5641 domain-containing protein n=1 Tax=Amphibalanus amphitrite TaxID=1232801 RepID=A0A6A4WAK3_AMPAM|nr:hypothetical protein FJT64_026756 [Amphibalanus amphitrite]
MSLLWKSDRRPVANLAVAESRTRRMTEKLTAEEFDEYDSHLANLRKTGVIEDAPIAEDRESAFYLPHHGVHRNGKLRVVYDGSAADGSGYSLNSYLEVWYQSAEQDLCDKVRSGLYMDDICLTFSSKDEACRAMEKTRVIFQEAGMSLHKTRVTGDVSEPSADAIQELKPTKTGESRRVEACTVSRDSERPPTVSLFDVTECSSLKQAVNRYAWVLRAWRHRRRVCDHLNRRWISEYLSALRCWSTSPRGRPSRVPGVGDVVLVRDEGPRGGWPLARVAELLRGPDGQARAAVIVLRGRTTRRPVNKLYALEAAGE